MADAIYRLLLSSLKSMIAKGPDHFSSVDLMANAEQMIGLLESGEYTKYVIDWIAAHATNGIRFVSGHD